MRKLVIFISCLFFTVIAHAEESQNQLFDCMDTATFEVNSQCIEATISQNIHFRDVQTSIAEQSSSLGGNVMASLSYYPKQQLIEVVAHRDALLAANNLALNPLHY